MKKKIDKEPDSQYNDLCSVANKMHEWLSGGVSPCQGEGRGFESRLALSGKNKNRSIDRFFFVWALVGFGMCSGTRWKSRLPYKCNSLKFYQVTITDSEVTIFLILKIISTESGRVPVAFSLFISSLYIFTFRYKHYCGFHQKHSLQKHVLINN